MLFDFQTEAAFRFEQWRLRVWALAFREQTLGLFGNSMIKCSGLGIGGYGLGAWA